MFQFAEDTVWMDNIGIVSLNAILKEPVIDAVKPTFSDPDITITPVMTNEQPTQPVTAHTCKTYNCALCANYECTNLLNGIGITPTSIRTYVKWVKNVLNGGVNFQSNNQQKQGFLHHVQQQQTTSRGHISVRPETQVMNTQNVVHHKPAPPAVSPVIVLDELVKKAVRKEWLELDYGAHWWSNDHAPTIYANSKLIPTLNTYLSHRWSELKSILAKRPVAPKKIRMSKPTDENSENSLSLEEQVNAHMSLGNAPVTSDACNQSSGNPENIDLLSLLLNSPPDIKPIKLFSRLENNCIASNSANNNRTASIPDFSESNNIVENAFRTDEISIAPSMFPSTSTNSLQSFVYNTEYNPSNSTLDVNVSYPHIKQVKENDNSLKMKIKLGDCKNKKETSGNKESKPRDPSKPKKLKAAKSDSPKKRKRTIKVKYPKSFNLKKCYTKMVRISDEILKKYTGLTNEDLKSLYSKPKKCNRNKASIKQANQSELLKNQANLNNSVSPNKIKLFPRNICGSPPGPLSKKPWNLSKAKNIKKFAIVSTASTACNSNIVVTDSSMTINDTAHASTTLHSTAHSPGTPHSSAQSSLAQHSMAHSPLTLHSTAHSSISSNSSLTVITCTEPQNSSTSNPTSTPNASPTKLNSPSSTEQMELSKDESLTVATTSSNIASAEEMINCEITKPVLDPELMNNDLKPSKTEPTEELSQVATTVTAPVEEVSQPAKTVTEPMDEEGSEQIKTVNPPSEGNIDPVNTVIMTVNSDPESVRTDSMQTETVSDLKEKSEFDNNDIPLKIDEENKPEAVHVSDTPLDETVQLNSNIVSSPHNSNETESSNSNVDNKQLENRAKTINGGKNNELLLKMLAGTPSKSRPITDYVNGKIIPLGQKHSCPTLAVIIKRKSTEDFPIISGSLSLANGENDQDSKQLPEETDNTIIKEISSPDHTTDVNMNYSNKILVNGFTTKNLPVQKSKLRELSPVTNDKADSSESNKENTSYERNKLEDIPSPPAKKIKVDERSDDNISKSNLKIDLSKMELEKEEVLDNIGTTDARTSNKANPSEKTVLDLPLNIFENYECISCLNKFVHLNDWRLHFNNYPKCANAQDSL